MKRSTLVLLAILLLASVLRFYRIDAQSLWSDEGSSVVQAGRDLPAIAANAALDIHPPLYYGLLHFWVMPFGTSESGVRSLSAVLGVALVLACYALGRRLWDEPIALLAAALAAVNPFQIVYSQEARMYMLMALLGALCVYATLRWQDSHGRMRAGWLVAYALCAVLGLYTHYLFPVIILACNIIALLPADPVGATLVVAQSGRPQSRTGNAALGSRLHSAFVPSWLVAWLGTQLLVLLAFAPWLPVAIRQLSTWPAGAQSFTLDRAPLVVLRTLAEGLTGPYADALWPSDAPWLLLFALLLLAGLVPARAVRRSVVAALVYLLAPIAVMFALMLFKDAYLKFLLIASPPFVLLVARGIRNLPMSLANAKTLRVFKTREVSSPPVPPSNRVRSISATSSADPLIARLLSPALLCLLAIPSFLAVQRYYFDPHFARDDYRGLVRAVEALAQPGDAIVLDAPGQQEIFNYYYHGSAPVFPLPRQRPIDAESTRRELEALVTQYRRIFAVFWATDESDPATVIPSWLTTHTFEVNTQAYGNVVLVRFDVARTVNEHPLDTHWEQGITLVSFADAGQSPAAGDVMPFTLVWRAAQPLRTRYKVFVHLLDPRGFVLAQHDGEPAGDTRPTTTWQPGEVISDTYGLLIPFGTPPGMYQIEVGLYDPDTGQRLHTVRGADHVPLDPFPVHAAARTPPLAAFPMQLLDAVSVDGLQLLGFRLDRLGAEGQPDVLLHPGDAVHLVLFWRKGAAASDPTYRLTLGSLARETTPTDGLYPVARWSADEVVRDDQLLLLPGRMSGTYPLLIDEKKIADVLVR